MKNRELYEKMSNELVGYQLGLHNIAVTNYRSLISCRSDVREKIHFTDADISGKSIADNIIKFGLRVVDRPMGLRSTVMPIEDFNESSLNYSYNNWEDQYVWNIIVAIPYFIKYKGKEYFVGNIDDWVSICTMLMFNPNIYSEFIYGYYVKRVKNEEERDSHIFSDELEFFDNPNFYERFDNIGKELVLKRIFEENRRLLGNLILANNNSQFGLLFRTSYERFVIRKTREQVKKLSYGKIK